MRRHLLCLLLGSLAAGCLGRPPAEGDLCDDTCRWAGDGECDDGGEGSLYSVCALGTDCGDCGPREAPTPPSNPGEPGPGVPPGEPGEPVDHGIPADFPPLSAQYRAHGTWRHDGSGFEDIPNQSFAAIDEIPVREGVATYGALYDSSAGVYRVELDDGPGGVTIRLELRSLDVGTYALGGFDGTIEREERRNGTYTYATDVEGGYGTVEIVGQSDTALWGRFSGRHCYRPTPGVNCSSVYDGRFSATRP